MTSRLLSAKSRLHCFGLPGLQPPSPVGTFRGARKWQQRRNRDGRGTGRDLKTSGQPAQSNYLPPAGTRKPLRSCCPIFVFLYRADTQPGYHTPSKQPGKPFSLLKTAQNVQFTWVGSLVTRKRVFYFSFSRCSHTFKLNCMIFSIKVFLKHRHVLWKPRFSVKNPAWFFEIQMSHVFFRNWTLELKLLLMGHLRPGFPWLVGVFIELSGLENRLPKVTKMFIQMPPDLETKTTGWVRLRTKVVLLIRNDVTLWK